MESRKNMGLRFFITPFPRRNSQQEKRNYSLALIILAISVTVGIYGVRYYLKQPLLSMSLSQQNETLALTEFTGKVEPAQEFKIAASMAGIVREKLVKVGDLVAPGDPLLSLENLESKDDLDRLKQQQETAYQQIDQLEQKILTFYQAAIVNDQLDEASRQVSASQLRSQQVPLHQRQDSIERAQANYDLALTQYQRMETLSKEGAISQAAFDRAKADMKIAQADLTSAKTAVQTFQTLEKEQDQQFDARKQLLEAQQLQQLADLKGQLQAAQLQYSQATRQIEKLRQRLGTALDETGKGSSQTVIKATEAGVVVDLPVAVGDQILLGAGLTKIAQLDRLNVKVPVTAQLINALKTGQKAVVKLGVAGETQEFSAEVVTINPMPSSDSTYSVEVQFKNPTRKLFVGQTAKVQFLAQ